jgi:replicative DNA helicase
MAGIRLSFRFYTEYSRFTAKEEREEELYRD